MDSKLLLDVNAIKSLRRAQGLSQEGLAYACEQRRLRVSIATIKRAEAGKQVSVRTASELARFFNVDLEQIIVRDSSSFENEIRRSGPDKKENQYLWTILWLRLENLEALSDVTELLQLRGCVWQEQLGNTIVVIFGHNSVADKGHIHAQKVALEIGKLLTEREKPPVHFYAALQLGKVRQNLGRTELPPETLQWFAQHSTSIPTDGIIVSPDIYHISNVNFGYRPLDEGESPLWLLQDAVCLERTLPMVGRSSELLQVNRILDDVGRRKRPTIVHITGPAGIGKSRFVRAIHEQAQLRQFIFTDIDLESGWEDPVKMLTTGLCRRLLVQAKRCFSDKQLKSKLFDGKCATEQQLVIADLLGLQDRETEKGELLTPGAATDVAGRIKAMAHIFSSLLDTAFHSLLVTIDNIHLGEAAGYSLLRELLDVCTTLPLTVVVTSRSETNANSELEQIGDEGFHLSTLRLGPLKTDDAKAICNAFEGHDEEYRRHCIRLAEGVPLYLIQLLTNSSGKAEEMPSSLKLLVEQKLSHLHDDERRVVELLSICNTPLPVTAIAVLTCQESFSPEPLVLAQLVKVDAELGVSLCHQLVRQIVYTGLPDDIRRMNHGALAAYIEEHFDGLPGVNELSLARHFELSGESFKAARAICYSSKELLQNGLYDKALELLNRALELVEAVPGRERDDLEIDIQLALSSVYKVKYGWVSPLLKCSYQRIEALCERLGNDKRLVMSLFGLWTIELATLNLKSAEKLAFRCLDISEKLNDPQGSMCAYTAIANTLFWRGRHRQAERAASDALALYQPEYTAISIQLLGQDPRALAGCFGAWSSSLLGKAKKAESYRNSLIATLQLLRHDFSMAIGFQGSAWVEFHHGKPEEALNEAEKLEALSSKMGFPFYRGVAALFIGWARHKLYRDPEAAAIVDQGYHRWLAGCGDKIAYSLYCTILGEIYVETGKLEKARHLLENGIAFSTEHHEDCYLPEMYRLLSFCLESSERESCLRKGLSYAAESPLFADRINRLLEATKMIPS